MRGLKEATKRFLLVASVRLQELAGRVEKRFASSRSHERRLDEAYDRDKRRFKTYAAILADGVYRPEVAHLSSQDSLAALIVMEYHRLEKTLSMPDPRAGAGQDAFVRCLLAVDEFVARFGYGYPIPHAAAVITNYLLGTPVDTLTEESKVALRMFTEKHPPLRVLAGNGKGGAENLNRLAVDPTTGAYDDVFFTSRRSVRGFKAKTVDRALIASIVHNAIYTPSVCNRQEWRLHAIDNKEIIRQCLKFQNGNRGFSDKIPLLFVVTVNLQCFVSVEERNQGWIDGGMFAMCLLLALHAKQLGACALNWSATRENDDGLRALLGIAESEIIIMLIGAGHIADDARVAVSARRPVQDILRFHDTPQD